MPLWRLACDRNQGPGPFLPLSLHRVPAAHWAVVHSGAYYPKENVRFEGASKVYSRIADTGFAVHFRFCPTCGTSVYWISEKQPDKLGVAVGCFADTTFPVPTLSVWEESKHPWLELDLSLDMDHLERGINADGTPMTR